MLLLLGIKIFLFLSNTNVIHNRFLIFLITFGISALIILALEFSDLKRKRIYQLMFYGIISVIMFGDVMHYGYFESLASISLFKQVGQIGAITDSIKLLLSFKKLLLIIDIPFMILYMTKYKKNREYEHSKLILLSLVGIIVGLFGYAGISGRYPSLRNQELFTYHTMDIADSLSSGEKLDAADLELLQEFKDENLKDYTKHKGIGKDRNLILLQVEALQNFVINLEYNGQEVTPNINKLIKDSGSLYFDNYFQLIGRGNTSDAEFVTNNSLHPSMEEYTYMQFADNTFYGLPWILRENDYSAWVFHGFEKEFWNREKAYVNQGFERFLSEEDFDFEETIGFGISDREFLDQSLEYIKELDKSSDDPFYSFIITLTSHTPYEMDEKYHVLEIKEEHKDNIVSDYLQAIHYTDKYIGKFIEDLKEEGIYDDSVIALYGDHFGINNSNEEVFGPMKDILGEKYNFDHIMNIPLVINVPNEDINETISKVGSQMDFYPTILNILGIKNTKGLMLGKDLVNYEGYNFVPTQTIMRRGSFIDRDNLFIFSGDGIFEHSKAIDRGTREEIGIEPLRAYYDKAIREINLGNIILKENLMDQIIRSGGDISNLRLGEGVDLLGEKKKIRNADKLDQVKAGIDKEGIVRTDLDGIAGGVEEIASFMSKNKKGNIIIRSSTEVRDEEESGYTLLKKANPEVMNQYIAEIDDFEKYFFVQRDGYNNIILNISDRDYTDEELIDFIELNPHIIGVVMDEDRLKSDLPEKLEGKNIMSYLEKSDMIEFIAK